MKLLLVYLLLALITGSWATRHGRSNRVWPLLVLSIVVTVGYMSRRMI
jgi:hypothetical protein